ncbi:MAG: Ig-like domain-containing protein, partial [Butyrivibrio sp.]|nr:Ig-like domain-containing protein [Butyrivibrio sp.]
MKRKIFSAFLAFAFLIGSIPADTAVAAEAESIYTPSVYLNGTSSGEIEYLKESTDISLQEEIDLGSSGGVVTYPHSENNSLGYFEDLEAMSLENDKGYLIVMQSDYTIDSDISVSDCSISLDLNGYELTFSDNVSLEGDFNICDNSPEKEGSITIADESCLNIEPGVSLTDIAVINGSHGGIINKGLIKDAGTVTLYDYSGIVQSEYGTASGKIEAEKILQRDGNIVFGDMWISKEASFENTTILQNDYSVYNHIHRQSSAKLTITTDKELCLGDFAFSIYNEEDCSYAEVEDGTLLFYTYSDSFPTEKITLLPENDLEIIRQDNQIIATAITLMSTDQPVKLYKDGTASGNIISQHDTISEAFTAIEKLKDSSEDYYITYAPSLEDTADSEGNYLIYVNGKNASNISSPKYVSSLTLMPDTTGIGEEENIYLEIKNNITLKGNLYLKGVSLKASSSVSFKLNGFELGLQSSSLQGAAIGSVTGNGTAKTSVLTIDGFSLDSDRLNNSAVYNRDSSLSVVVIEGSVTNIGTLKLSGTSLEVHGKITLGNVYADSTSAIYGKSNISVKNKTEIKKVTSTITIAGNVRDLDGNGAALTAGSVYSYVQDKVTYYALLDMAGLDSSSGDFGIYTMPESIAAGGIAVVTAKKETSNNFSISKLNFPDTITVSEDSTDALCTLTETAATDSSPWEIGYTSTGSNYYKKGYVSKVNGNIVFIASDADSNIKVTYTEDQAEYTTWVEDFAGAVKEINNLATARDYTITVYDSDSMSSYILDSEPTKLTMPKAKYVNNLVIKSADSSSIQSIYYTDSKISLTADSTTFENIKLIQVYKTKNSAKETVYADVNFDVAKDTYKCPKPVTVNIGNKRTLDIEGSILFNSPLTVNGGGKQSILTFGDDCGFITATNSDASSTVTSNQIVIYGSVKNVGTLTIGAAQSLQMYKYAKSTNKYASSTLSAYNLQNNGIINVLTGNDPYGNTEASSITNASKTYNNAVSVTGTFTNAGKIYVQGSLKIANLELLEGAADSGSVFASDGTVAGAGNGESNSHTEIYATGVFNVTKSISSSTADAYLYTARKITKDSGAYPYLNVSGSVNIESDYGVNVGVVKITNYSKSKLGVVTEFSETLSTYSNYPAALSIVLTTKKGTTDQFVPISDCIKDPAELDFVIITSAEYENYKSGSRIGIRYANTEPLYIATGSSTGIIPTITPTTSADSAKITWSSKNKKIVKVTSTGDTTATFTGVKNGTTIVYATLKSTGEKIPCTVISTGIEFSVSASQARGKVGKTYQLSASAEPESIFESCTISWSSSDEDIATVDSTGKITGISTGEVTITASTTALEKTYSDTCTYTVTAKDYVNVCDCGAEAGDGDDDRVAIQYAVNTFKYNKTEYE